MSFPAPSFNHVAMSVPADLLDETGRNDLTRFYKEVFGFDELPTETVDRKKLVLVGRQGRAVHVHHRQRRPHEPAPASTTGACRWRPRSSSTTTSSAAKKFQRGRSARRHHRQARRRPPAAVDHLVLRGIPAPDDGRGAVLEVQAARRRQRRGLSRGLPVEGQPGTGHRRVVRYRRGPGGGVRTRGRDRRHLRAARRPPRRGRGALPGARRRGARVGHRPQ